MNETHLFIAYAIKQCALSSTSMHLNANRSFRGASSLLEFGEIRS